MAFAGKAHDGGGLVEWWKNQFDPKHPGPEWICTADAVAWTGRTSETLRRWVAGGYVRSRRAYGRRFYRTVDLPERALRPPWEVAKHPRIES